MSWWGRNSCRIIRGNRRSRCSRPSCRPAPCLERNSPRHKILNAVNYNKNKLIIKYFKALASIHKLFIFWNSNVYQRKSKQAELSLSWNILWRKYRFYYLDRCWLRIVVAAPGVAIVGAVRVGFVHVGVTDNCPWDRQLGFTQLSLKVSGRLLLLWNKYQNSNMVCLSVWSSSNSI